MSQQIALGGDVEDAIDSQKVNVLLKLVRARKEDKINQNDLYTVTHYAALIEVVEQNRSKAFSELTTLDSLIDEISCSAENTEMLVRNLHDRFAYLI